TVFRSVFTDSVKRLALDTFTCFVIGLPLPSRYWISTAQLFTASGFSIVRNSVKPPPTLPSAKYHVLLTGTLPGVGLGEGDGEGLGDGVGEGEGVGDPGVPAGISASLSANFSVTQTVLLPSTISPSNGLETVVDTV